MFGVEFGFGFPPMRRRKIRCFNISDKLLKLFFGDEKPQIITDLSNIPPGMLPLLPGSVPGNVGQSSPLFPLALLPPGMPLSQIIVLEQPQGSAIQSPLFPFQPANPPQNPLPNIPLPNVPLLNIPLPNASLQNILRAPIIQKKGDDSMSRKKEHEGQNNPAPGDFDNLFGKLAESLAESLESAFRGEDSEEFEEQIVAAYSLQIEELTQNLERLSTEQLDELIGKAREVTRRQFGSLESADDRDLVHYVRKLSWPNRRYLGRYYANKFVEFGFAIPPIIFLLVNIGLMVVKLVQLFIEIRRLRRKPQPSQSARFLPEPVSPEGRVREDALREEKQVVSSPILGQEYGGIIDRIVPWLADRAIPAVMKLIPQYLEQKKDVLIEVVVNSLRAALDRLIDNLIAELRNKYQDLI
jgi:hypothetical protein